MILAEKMQTGKVQLGGRSSREPAKTMMPYLKRWHQSESSHTKSKLCLIPWLCAINMPASHIFRFRDAWRRIHSSSFVPSVVVIVVLFEMCVVVMFDHGVMCTGGIGLVDVRCKSPSIFFWIPGAIVSRSSCGTSWLLRLFFPSSFSIPRT